MLSIGKCVENTLEFLYKICKERGAIKQYLKQIKYAPSPDIVIPFPADAVEEKWVSDRAVSLVYHRTALFASFSSKGIVDETTLFYLTELKKVVDRIVFVADNPMLPQALEKLKPLVDAYWCVRHGEYDFGSYKRAFEVATQNGFLKDTDELIFCNDSCIGPVRPFHEFFEKFSGSDFYGMTKNEWGYQLGPYWLKTAKIPHIQSYFLVMSKKVFSSGYFIDFITGVTRQKNKVEVIINYEQGCSRLLAEHGFPLKVWCAGDENDERNATYILWQAILQNGFFLKKDLLKHLRSFVGLNRLLELRQFPFRYLDGRFVRADSDLWVNRIPEKPQVRVAIHIYIDDWNYWPSICEKLFSIYEFDYDLYVTCINSDPAKKEIIQHSFPLAHVTMSDIPMGESASFVEFVRNVDLNGYDVIAKFHTLVGKNLPLVRSRSPEKRIFRKSCRFVRRNRNFQNNLDLFLNYPKIGIVGKKRYVYGYRLRDKALESAIQQAMQILGIKPKGRFSSGSGIFLIRASLLNCLKNQKAWDSFEQFVKDSGRDLDEVCRHVLVRLAYAQGYGIRELK